MPRIDQLLPGFAEGDAISAEVMVFDGILRKWGIETGIYTDMQHVAPEVRHLCRDLGEYQAERDDVAIHHYSIWSKAVDAFLDVAARKILVYHNITPAHFFRGFDDGLADQLTVAREKLGEAARKADRVWADSAFNAGELAELGIDDVHVFPLLFNPQAFDAPDDDNVFARFPVRIPTLTWVGRLVPNKRVEDLITAFAWYNRTINPRSRLLLIGSERSCPRYYLMLRMLVCELKVPNVCFERYASPAKLAAYYEITDLFVTASDHEGYCLPLVEAIYKDVPVLAKERGGMPEALGGAGVLYDDLEPEELAALFDILLTDDAVRADVMQSQERRKAEIAGRDPESELREALAGLI
jgi:glycosyltransferase involved in cell wall biosynthesis